MNILLITPAPPKSLKGNRVTAQRWAGILRKLGHHVAVAQEYTGQRCDVMVALHAGRSFPSVEHFRKEHPRAPLIVALTGTDLYDEIARISSARQSLEMASRLIVLQPLGITELPGHLRTKTTVIHQSAVRLRVKPAPRKDVFEVCVMGHLRPVKDPFRTARAARLLPASSRLHVIHLGAALSDDMAQQAERESSSNPRYTWMGPLPRPKALKVLARCRLLVLTSILEGGANVISEALALDVPVIATRIPGSIGILGPDYPGYFATGDTHALTNLLELAETDQGFYQSLQEVCRQLAPLVDPARESQAWKTLLREVVAECKENRCPQPRRGNA